MRLSRNWVDVRDEWPALADLGRGISGYCFQTREWIDAWLATQAKSVARRSIFAIVETDEGRKVAFAPLEFTSQAALKVLTFSGGLLADYAAPLLVDGMNHASVADDVWTALTKDAPSFDLVRVRHVPPRVGHYANPFAQWQKTLSSQQARTASFDGDWDGFYQRTHSKPTRSKLRRKWQALADLGELRLVTASTSAEAMAIVDRLIALKAGHLDDESNVLARSDHADFYRRLTRTAPDHVRAHGLYCGDRLVAAHWGVLTGSHYMSLQTSYEGGEWAKFSPGLLATRELFAWCHRIGVTTFDFGLGDAPYKGRWCDQPSGLVSIVRGRSVAGHAAGFVLQRRGIREPADTAHGEVIAART